MSEKRADSSSLAAGWAKVEITPALPVELAGNFSLRPRLGRRVRDPLYGRVAYLHQGAQDLFLVSLDLLCLSEQLHRVAVERLTPGRPERVLLVATHTHASFGGLFPPPGASVLGHAAPERLAWLAGRIVEAAHAAERDARPARAFFGRAEVKGFTSCRRRRFGPRDDEFRVLELRRTGAPPLAIVNASGHPVVVSEKDPHAVSADWPGELCRRLEEKKTAPLFFPAALGGTSPLFSEFPMELDRHLELLGNLAEQGVEKALAAGEPIERPELLCAFFRMAHGRPLSEPFAAFGLPGRIADAALWPVRRWLRRGFEQMLAHSEGVPLHLVRLGKWLLVASAHELGAGLVGELLRLGRRRGLWPMVASLADGYAGYLHLEEEYRHFPEKGFRFLAFYENALAIFGRRMAAGILRQTEGWQD